MIAERLEPDKIPFGLKGNFSEAIDRLCRQSAVPDLAARLHAKEADSDNNRYSYIGNGIAVPHVRLDNLEGPELILGLSSEGISFGNHTINVVLLLASPADQPPQHLQLLQRVGTLLPAICHELIVERDARASGHRPRRAAVGVADVSESYSRADQLRAPNRSHQRAGIR